MSTAHDYCILCVLGPVCMFPNSYLISCACTLDIFFFISMHGKMYKIIEAFFIFSSDFILIIDWLIVVVMIEPTDSILTITLPLSSVPIQLSFSLLETMVSLPCPGCP